MTVADDHKAAAGTGSRRESMEMIRSMGVREGGRRARQLAAISGEKKNSCVAV